ncbi:DNAJ heat shock N-terminal domain-containing protein [Euphorbia peplus]|nr:DNAJ heat shock N-terminal domain-containing protein [Euphorbia peplus]
MECNKEEAIRAKESAERKMQNGDFLGARRIGMKAQRLYPDLDNIAQLLMVCDVLCSAENKIYGSEMDWYGILQIERFSDVSVIKKQFRKLALSLHPDKNKFAGAESAFKLIGDANRVLMDPTKRSTYDMKCGGSSIPTRPKPDQSNQNKKHEPVFWTCCSTCNMWYEYHRQYVTQTLKCQSCSQPFIAHDMGAPPELACGQSVNGKRVSNQGSSQNVASKSPRMPSHEMFTKVVFNSMPAGKAADSTGTFQAKTERASETGREGHKFKRRSSRKKSRVSHKEILSDDDDFVAVPPKRSKGETKVEKSSGNGRPSRSSSRKRKTRENDDKVEEVDMSEKAGTNLDKNDEKSEIGRDKSNSNEAPKSDICVYPDPNFSNFERGREKSCFAANQVWAVYDKLDSMPRFYAKIKEVITPGFKLLITWLDRSPNDEAERKWSSSGLPIACGKFENGDSEEVEDNLMFSHVMPHVNAGLNGYYFVYPHKGETWAIFKNWDLEWSAEPVEHGPPYEFDFVEILTDFKVDIGIGVAYLGKVKGFISIFQPAARDEILAFTMRPSELYKFSHQIPSFKLTGKEGEGVPVGSYELDTAALPINFWKLADTNEISAPNNIENGAKNGTSSPNKPNGSGKDSNVADTGQQAKKKDGGKVTRRGKPTPSQQEGTSASQANEKLPIRRKLKTNKIIAETFTPRRSPRDLKKCRNRRFIVEEDINEHAATSKDNIHGEQRSLSCEPEDKMDLHVKDESLGNSSEGRKSSSSRVIEVEPYDFKKEKSEDKFQVDQIWAMHSDEDGIPRNYVQVKKIDGSSSSFRLHVAVLENIFKNRSVRPASSGIFKVKDGELVVLPITAFSHQVKPRKVGNDSFEIRPKKGEIWGMKKTGGESTYPECDIVEVVDDDNKSVKVVVLKEHKKHIFTAPKGTRSASMDIKRGEFFDRFSHKCLAYHMGDEDSRLKGYWQLDPSSIPGSVILLD